MELAVFALLICASLGLLVFRPHRLVVVVTLLVVVASVGYGMISQSIEWHFHAAARMQELPLPRRTDGFVTSSSCRSCHPGEFESWHKTFHRTMTQPATEETIVASFDEVELRTDDQSAKLFRRGDDFWVETVSPSWEQQMFARWADGRGKGEPDPYQAFRGNPPRIHAKVVMTTGSHHFQAYWMRSDHGPELWQFPWRYHIGKQRWIHRKDVFLAPPEWRPGMWFRVWNSDCSTCHSCGPVPGRDLQTGDTYFTEVAELGIACESCHGPAESHIEKYRNPIRRYRQHFTLHEDSSIVNPAKLAHERSSEVCGQCHSHFDHGDQLLTMLSIGPQYRPGAPLSDYGALKSVDDNEVVSRFWADGTNRSGGREFMGMSRSGCYLTGKMSCLSCHSMHRSDPNDQLSAGMESNLACVQCHQHIGDELSAHTHHGPNSSGSHCYNCHMPHTNYALLKAIRSHQIDSPLVVPTSNNTRANACNLCHLDRTLQWTAERLHDWYGIGKPELSGEEQKTSAALLWALKGDAGQRVIAAWHFGWQPAREASGTHWLVPALAQLLNDPYAAVRWVAYEALCREQAFAEFNYEFDGSNLERHDAVDRAMEIWHRMQPREHDQERFGNHVLLDANGTLLEDEMRSLLDAQDRRMVSGVE